MSLLGRGRVGAYLPHTEVAVWWGLWRVGGAYLPRPEVAVWWACWVGKGEDAPTCHIPRRLTDGAGGGGGEG